jgi:hypothetical protein
MDHLQQELLEFLGLIGLLALICSPFLVIGFLGWLVEGISGYDKPCGAKRYCHALSQSDPRPLLCKRACREAGIGHRGF